MFGRLKVFQKGLVLVGLLLACELFLASALVILVQQSEAIARRVAHYNQILSKSNQLFQSVMDTGYSAVQAVKTRRPEYIGRFDALRSTLSGQMAALEELVKDNHQYVKSLNQIKPLVAAALNDAACLVQYERLGQYEAAGTLRGSADRSAREIAVLKALQIFMNDQEPLIAENVAAEVKATDTVKHWLAGGLVLNLILAFLLSWLFVRTITRRIDILVDNTARLSAGKALHLPASDRDELGHLDRVFHQMAATLAEAARRERASVDFACDVICSVDSQGNFQRVSAAALDLWGLQPDRLIGAPLSEVIAAEDVKIFQETIEKMRSGNLESVYIETSLKPKKEDPDRRNLLWSAHWSTRDQCLFCVVHDITERKLAQEKVKASEARVRTILDNTLVGLLTIDESGTIELVNPRATEMFQWNARELEGQPLTMLFPQSALKPADFVNDVRKKARAHGLELSACRKNGTVMPVEISLADFQSAGGRSLLVNFVDISERIELGKMKQEFMLMISQDLRLPLSSVQTYLTKLTAGSFCALGERGLRGVQIASRNVNRLLRLLMDLLEAAKFEPGKLELECQMSDLGGMLERSVEAVRTFADKHSVSLEYSPVNLMIYADQDRIERVIINLLSNAAKFSPAGSVVSLVVEDTAAHIIVKVVDRGRGIPPDHIHSVFERFSQVSVADAKQKGGTGLGLAICKSIIEEHGGVIGVESQEGKGSTFWFDIPKTRDAAS